MSQLNNKSEKGGKKGHETRNMIIFLSIFAIICIGITVICILKNKKNVSLNQNTQIVDSKNQNSNNNSDDTPGISSIQDTYYENYLKIINVNFTDGTKKSDGKYQVEGNYIQIDGLKDVELQQKINDYIKDKIMNLYDKNSTSEYINIYTNCTANFANVLSISSYKYDENNLKNIGINIDLSTGNEIKFNDLFKKDAGIKSIISKCAYDSLIVEATSGGDGSSIIDEPDMTKNSENDNFEFETEKEKQERAQKYAEIEDKVFEILSNYNSNNELEYSFSSRCIYIYKDNSIITIPMKKYYEQIAIYNRFKGNTNIYDGKYENQDIIENKKIPVFAPENSMNVHADIDMSDGPVNIVYTNIQRKSDNLMYAIVMQGYIEENDYNSEIMEKAKNLAKEELEKKSEKYNNSQQACYLEVGIVINDYEGYTLEKAVKEYTASIQKRDELFNGALNYIQDGNVYIYWTPEEKNNGYIWKNYISNYKDISYNNELSDYKYNVNTKKLEQTKNNDINNLGGDEQIQNNNTSEGKLIVIDAGHQLKGNSEKEPIGPGATETKAKVTTGATGVATGQKESELNLKVSLLLQEELTKKGYKVIMTRTSENVDLSNSQRAKIANENSADAFIRIHANSADSSSAKGVLTMCQTSQNKYNGNIAQESYSLSKVILDNICKKTGAQNRGVTRTDDMSGINWCTVPTTIVEMGFLSNSEEDKLLADENYQKKIVDGIVEGLEEYFS